MQRKSWIMTAALVVGLTLGFVLSPLAQTSSASAQTQPPAQTQTSGIVDSLRSLFLDKLAGALNIQRGALDSAITSAGNSTADEAVQQGTLTQEQADRLRARVAAGDYGSLFGERGGRGGRGGSRVNSEIRQAMFTAAAQALNLTEAELTTQLQSGQTIAQIAQAQGTTEQVVKDAALAAAKSQLDQQVAAGTITQAQADVQYAQLQAQGLEFLVNCGPGGRGGRGGSGDVAPVTPSAPAAPTTPETPTTPPVASPTPEV